MTVIKQDALEQGRTAQELFCIIFTIILLNSYWTIKRHMMLRSCKASKAWQTIDNS